MSWNRRVKDNAAAVRSGVAGGVKGGVGYSVAGGGSIFPVDFSVDTRTAQTALRSRYTPTRRSSHLLPARRRPPNNNSWSSVAGKLVTKHARTPTPEKFVRGHGSVRPVVYTGQNVRHRHRWQPTSSVYASFTIIVKYIL